MNLYLWLNEKVTGPFSAESLEEQLKSGVLDSQVLACGESEKDWRPLGEILASDTRHASLTTKKRCRYLIFEVCSKQWSRLQNALAGKKGVKFAWLSSLVILGFFALGYFEGWWASFGKKNFFQIRSVQLLEKAPKDERGVWKAGATPGSPWEFQPCLKINVAVKENILTEKLLTKAYFYSAEGKLLAEQASPCRAGLKLDGQIVPYLLSNERDENLYFEIPEAIRGKPWRAVVVFGDKDEAHAWCYPRDIKDSAFDYPEKALVHSKQREGIIREPDTDLVIDCVVKTRNPRHPQLTLFLRPPGGVSNIREVRGVLAVAGAASNLTDFRREFQNGYMGPGTQSLFQFASKHKLAILTWAVRPYWNPNKNYNELSEEEAKAIDQDAQDMANAWENGVKKLIQRYSLPEKNFLLWGCSAPAQWAARLCLRKPQYFLAVHAHVPSSFDRPTPEAANVLWCLTTGEAEPGCDRSRQFVEECRKLIPNRIRN